MDAAAHGGRIALVGGDQPHQRPCRLARGRWTDSFYARIFVAGDAFAPAAIAVLVVDEPFDAAAHVALVHVFADQFQSAQYLPRAVNIIDTPAAKPRSVIRLVLLDELDRARDNRMSEIAVFRLKAQAFQHAAGD